MALTKDEKIIATQLFVENHSAYEVAEYIVNMQSSLDGMSACLSEYRDAYAELWNTKNAAQQARPTDNASGEICGDCLETLPNHLSNCVHVTHRG